jgi:hypothetical protein
MAELKYEDDLGALPRRDSGLAVRFQDLVLATSPGALRLGFVVVVVLESGC